MRRNYQRNIPVEEVLVGLEVDVVFTVGLDVVVDLELDLELVLIVEVDFFDDVEDDSFGGGNASISVL